MVELKKVFIDKNEFEQKLNELKRMGIDPQKLKNLNRGLFNAIIMKMNPSQTQHMNPAQYDQLWWSLGNPELAKKFEKIEPLKQEGQDEDVKALLKKLKKPSGKKNRIGKFRKK